MLPMLTLAEFAAVLQRYAEGTCTAAELGLVNRWLAQLEEPTAPELPSEELAHVRLTLWQRIEKDTRE